MRANYTIVGRVAFLCGGVVATLRGFVRPRLLAVDNRMIEIIVDMLDDVADRYRSELHRRYLDRIEAASLNVVRRV